jgi:hypothetical protein
MKKVGLYKKYLFFIRLWIIKTRSLFYNSLGQDHILVKLIIAIKNKRLIPPCSEANLRKSSAKNISVRRLSKWNYSYLWSGGFGSSDSGYTS